MKWKKDASPIYVDQEKNASCNKIHLLLRVQFLRNVKIRGRQQRRGNTQATFVFYSHADDMDHSPFFLYDCVELICNKTILTR